MNRRNIKTEKDLRCAVWAAALRGPPWGTKRRPLAPAGPPGHTRGMEQERLDYADTDLPPVWAPAVGSLLTMAMVLLLVIAGALAFFWFAVLVPGIDC